MLLFLAKTVDNMFHIPTSELNKLCATEDHEKELQ